MNGFLTSDRIWGVTVFVDHARDYTYGHLMRGLDLTETLLAKKAFEKFAVQGSNTVKQYHADNGQYADEGFMAALLLSVQLVLINKMALLKDRSG
ncbi:hypothetical protein ACHAXS_000553 [Conticribra weissflogii]